MQKDAVIDDEADTFNIYDYPGTYSCIFSGVNQVTFKGMGELYVLLYVVVEGQFAGTEMTSFVKNTQGLAEQLKALGVPCDEDGFHVEAHIGTSCRVTIHRPDPNSDVHVVYVNSDDKTVTEEPQSDR